MKSLASLLLVSSSPQTRLRTRALLVTCTTMKRRQVQTLVMRLLIHLFQRSLWDLFQPSGLDHLQTLAIVNLALLKKNTVDSDVVYCSKIGAYESNPRFKELRF